MPVYKVTLGFVSHIMGPSESYWSREGATDSDIGDLVSKLLDARIKLISESVQLTGVRIGLAPLANTDQPAPRRSNFYPPDTYTMAADGINLTVPGKGRMVAQVLPVGKTLAPVNDQTRSCLQVRVRFNADRRSNRYFAFPPDNVLFAEPNSFRPGEAPFWRDDFYAFQQHLQQYGWQIRARSADPGYEPVSILKWVMGEVAPSPMGAIVASTPPPAFNMGDWVVVKGVRRKGTDQLSYNGKYQIAQINKTFDTGLWAIYLAGTEAGEPLSIKIPGKMQKIAYRYYSIDFFTGLRAAVHKRGRPFSVPLGRRKIRPSLSS